MIDLTNYKNIIILSGAGISTSSGLPDFTSNQNPLLITDWDKYEPTKSHFLAVELYKKGILKRVYTQNIDRLYQKAGLPEDKIVECHGNYIDGIVNYGMELNKFFFEFLIKDFLSEDPNDKPDFLLVMGTRLQVAPVCCIPNLIKKIDKYAIINNRSDIMNNSFNNNNNFTKWIKIGKRKVSLQPKWKKWQIIEMSCDDFCTMLSI
jgi:NAD-dependent SIR2 family protein deacetylase